MVTCNPHTLLSAFRNVQLHIYGGSQSVQLGYTTTATTTESLNSFCFERYTMQAGQWAVITADQHAGCVENLVSCFCCCIFLTVLLPYKVIMQDDT